MTHQLENSQKYQEDLKEPISPLPLSGLPTSTTSNFDGKQPFTTNTSQPIETDDEDDMPLPLFYQKKKGEISSRF